jgi:hypothetical protein
MKTQHIELHYPDSLLLFGRGLLTRVNSVECCSTERTKEGMKLPWLTFFHQVPYYEKQLATVYTATRLYTQLPPCAPASSAIAIGLVAAVHDRLLVRDAARHVAALADVDERHAARLACS